MALLAWVRRLLRSRPSPATPATPWRPIPSSRDGDPAVGWTRPLSRDDLGDDRSRAAVQREDWFTSRGRW